MMTVTGLVKRFPGVMALDGVDLDIRAGEIHALVGENGAGKSTLVKALAGIHAPDGGTMTFDGAPYTPASAAVPMSRLEMGTWARRRAAVSTASPISVATTIPSTTSSTFECFAM